MMENLIKIIHFLFFHFSLQERRAKIVRQNKAAIANQQVVENQCAVSA